MPDLGRFIVEAVLLLRSDENDCCGRNPFSDGSSSSAMVSSLASLSPSSSTSSEAVPGLSPCPEPSLEFDCPFPDVCSGYVHSLLPLRHPARHDQSLYFLVDNMGELTIADGVSFVTLILGQQGYACLINALSYLDSSITACITSRSGSAMLDVFQSWRRLLPTAVARRLGSLKHDRVREPSVISQVLI